MRRTGPIHTVAGNGSWGAWAAGPISGWERPQWCGKATSPDRVAVTQMHRKRTLRWILVMYPWDGFAVTITARQMAGTDWAVGLIARSS